MKPQVTQLTKGQLRAKTREKQEDDRRRKQLDKQHRDDLWMQEWIIQAGEFKDLVDRNK